MGICQSCPSGRETELPHSVERVGSMTFWWLYLTNYGPRIDIKWIIMFIQGSGCDRRMTRHMIEDIIG